MLSCYLSSVSTNEIGRSRIGGQNDNDQEKVPTWIFRLRNVCLGGYLRHFRSCSHSAGPRSRVQTGVSNVKRSGDGRERAEDGIVRAPMNNSLRMHSRRKGDAPQQHRSGASERYPSIPLCIKHSMSCKERYSNCSYQRTEWY